MSYLEIAICYNLLGFYFKPQVGPLGGNTKLFVDTYNKTWWNNQFLFQNKKQAVYFLCGIRWKI